MKRFRKVTKQRLFTRHMAGLGRPVRPNGALRSHRTCSLRCRPRTRSHLHLFPSHKAAPSLGWKEEQTQAEDRVGRTEEGQDGKQGMGTQPPALVGQGRIKVHQASGNQSVGTSPFSCLRVTASATPSNQGLHPSQFNEETKLPSQC